LSCRVRNGDPLGRLDGILRGAGRAFYAGGDLVATNELAEQSATVTAMYRFQDKLARLVTACIVASNQ
jgi:enoyl-CoA hydratase/carnithine racemase